MSRVEEADRETRERVHGDMNLDQCQTCKKNTSHKSGYCVLHRADSLCKRWGCLNTISQKSVSGLCEGHRKIEFNKRKRERRDQ